MSTNVAPYTATDVSGISTSVSSIATLTMSSTPSPDPFLLRLVLICKISNASKQI
jgi:hypothetical protein